MDGGLLYGGGFGYIGIQTIGVVAVAAWITITMSIIFIIIKKTVGLRVSREEEISGLDITEHNITSSYADFMPIVPSVLGTGVSADIAAPFITETTIHTGSSVSVADNNKKMKMTKVEIITKQSKFEQLKAAMDKIGISGMTVTQVLGCGIQKGSTSYYRGNPVESNLLPKVQVEIVVSKIPVETVIAAAKEALYTGSIGDGKIFVYDVENVVKVRTGEEGYDALQDVE